MKSKQIYSNIIIKSLITIPPIIAILVVVFSCQACQLAQPTSSINTSPVITALLKTEHDIDSGLTTDSIIVNNSGGKLYEFSIQPIAILHIETYPLKSESNFSEGTHLYSISLRLSENADPWVQSDLCYGSDCDETDMPCPDETDLDRYYYYSVREFIRVQIYKYFDEGDYNSNATGLIIKKYGTGNRSEIDHIISELNKMGLRTSTSFGYSCYKSFYSIVSYKDYKGDYTKKYLFVYEDGSKEFSSPSFNYIAAALHRSDDFLCKFKLNTDIHKISADDLDVWIKRVVGVNSVPY